MAFLKTLFGPGKEEIWRKLCAEIDGQYVDGGFWKGDAVKATHGSWTVTLDTYTVSDGKTSTTFTRMRAPFANSNGFRFTVYRKSLFSGIGKWFGMQDIEIGDPAFDDAFILKSNDETKLRELLGDAKMRELLQGQPAVYFSVKDDEGFFSARFPDGVDELNFQVIGVIKDVERLKLLFELFSETLDQLCRIGAAYESNPNFSV